MYLDQPGLMELWDRIKAVFAPKSHTHNYAGSSSPGGAAASAAKLSTPRDIVLRDAVDSIAQPFDGSKNVSIPVYSLKESYLDWGGKSIKGLVSPIGCALSADHSANRLAFIDGGAVSIEYSSDGGATWTDYGYSANLKSQLFTKSVGIPIGRTVSSEEYTASSATRVTISAEDKVYTKPRKMLMNISTSSALSLTVETRTGEDGAAWKEYGTYTISGWSGWNDIPLVLLTFGGRPSQTTNIKHLRLTIRATRVGSNKKECQLLAIRLFGDTDWISASSASGKGPMSSTGHLYDFDMAANATFPAGVKASSFTGQLNGSIATKDGVSASLEKLPTWTATPTDSTQLVRRDTDDKAAYGRVTFLTVWNYIKGKADALYAPKASPAFTGNPTAPTPPFGDSSKSLATTEFVANAITGASAPTDYIVAQGTCDFWTWRMWASGVAECWGSTGETYENVTSEWGSLYEGSAHSNGFPGNTSESSALAFSVKLDGATYTRLFKNVPEFCSCSFNPTGGAGISGIEIGGGLSALSTPTVYLLRPTPSRVDGHYSYCAKGRWR